MDVGELGMGWRRHPVAVLRGCAKYVGWGVGVKGGWMCAPHCGGAWNGV